MNIEEIKEKLENEKDPANFLKVLLEKEEDEILIKEIKKLLESYEDTLENLAFDAPKILIEDDEREEEVEDKEIEVNIEDSRNIREDYGVSVRSDYSRGLNSRMDNLREELENSGLASRSGFHQTSESRQVVEEKIGEYRTGEDQNIDKVEYQQNKKDKRKELLYG